MAKKHVMDRGLQLSMFRVFLKKYYQMDLISEIEWRVINNGIVASEHMGKSFTNKQVEKLDQLLSESKVIEESSKQPRERDKWLSEILSLIEIAQSTSRKNKNSKTLKMGVKILIASIALVVLVNIVWIKSSSVLGLIFFSLGLFIFFLWVILKNICPQCGKYFSFSTVKSEETDRYVTSREEEVVVGQLYIENKKIGEVRNSQNVNYQNVDFRDIDECIHCGHIKEIRRTETRQTN
jgi:hypothetical protein